MKTDRIFIGDIKKCTKYNVIRYFDEAAAKINGQFALSDFDHSREYKIYKEDAILLKIEKDCYVELDNINTIFDYTKIYRDIKMNGYKFNELLLPTIAYREGSLFVDPESIKPYYDKDKENENISIKQLKKKNKRKIGI